MRPYSSSLELGRDYICPESGRMAMRPYSSGLDYQSAKMRSTLTMRSIRARPYLIL